jgi:hypothetical protein
MKNIKAVLAKLTEELQRSEDVDSDARETLEGVHRDAGQLQGPDGTETEWVLERVNELESRFAATHPVLERMMRELADAIAKMGI